jgi:hypothetical protein
LRYPLAFALLAALYFSLIIACYFFITTREATVWQLTLTLLSALGVPLLFFVVAAAGANYAVGNRSPANLLKRTARNFWKVFAISIPVVLLAVLSVYLLNKLERRVQLSPEERARMEFAATNAAEGESEASTAEARGKPTVRWKYLLVSALRLFVLGLFLPLAAMHLWIATVRDGLRATVARSPALIAHAFSARSVLTYGIGMIVFGLIPYFLITKRTPVSSTTFELLILGSRLLIALALMLFGWVMTMTALARADGQTATSELMTDAPQSQITPVVTAG